MLELRPMLPYGFRCYTGVIPSNSEIDRYNAYQQKINGFIIERGSVPEELLNGSHNLFVAMSSR